MLLHRPRVMSLSLLPAWAGMWMVVIVASLLAVFSASEALMQREPFLVVLASSAALVAWCEFKALHECDCGYMTFVQFALALAVAVGTLFQLRAMLHSGVESPPLIGWIPILGGAVLAITLSYFNAVWCKHLEDEHASH